MDKGVVVETAPIIRYMLGWSYMAVRFYCYNKKWSIYEVDEKNY